MYWVSQARIRNTQAGQEGGGIQFLQPLLLITTGWLLASIPPIPFAFLVGSDNEAAALPSACRELHFEEASFEIPWDSVFTSLLCFSMGTVLCI